MPGSGNHQFTDADKDLMENLLKTGQLDLSSTVADLEKLPACENFSKDFSHATLKRHLDTIAKKVAIALGGKSK